MAAAAAHLDDDWPHVGDLNTDSEQELLPLKGRAAAAAGRTASGEATPQLPLLLLLQGHDGDDGDVLELHENSSFLPGESGAFRSKEELGNVFDARLSECFRNVHAGTESIAAVSEITEDTLLEKDEIWKVLTTNYGQVMPVDWKCSQMRSLQVPIFNLEEKPRKTDVTAELSDDEELREQLDMHSIIVSCLADEPLFTAEQVIEEIEEMMQDSPDVEAKNTLPQSDFSMLSLDMQRSNSSPGFKDRVRTLSVAELNECMEETETNIRRFSEELVQQLARRDELEFEKEVKNSFISVLIDVQNRQKEHRELLKKKKKFKGGAGSSHGRAEKTLGVVSTSFSDSDITEVYVEIFPFTHT
ncbi:hypothetical protein JOB18_004471 [Solea senegalensis]|uniref:Fasciculation and elongation protein zeta 2 n=1 Tax=Solea senegalensis TaxID=28829 RepID=A0AAV6PSC3_SOLSE|nr:hypothetical protein JOB18_004471 [Solea senegalensis]